MLRRLAPSSTLSLTCAPRHQRFAGGFHSTSTGQPAVAVYPSRMRTWLPALTDPADTSYASIESTILPKILRSRTTTRKLECLGHCSHRDVGQRPNGQAATGTHDRTLLDSLEDQPGPHAHNVFAISLRKLLAGSALGQYGRSGLPQDEQVEGQGPVLDITKIEADRVITFEIGPSADLPQAG